MNTNQKFLKCPQCVTAPLYPELATAPPTGKQIEIDRCLQCQGVWHDTGEFQEFAPDLIFGIFTPLDTERVNATCPHCSENLRSYEHGHPPIHILACNGCAGIWIGKHEAEKIPPRPSNPGFFWQDAGYHIFELLSSIA